jgi:hypothetical protein
VRLRLRFLMVDVETELISGGSGLWLKVGDGLELGSVHVGGDGMCLSEEEGRYLRRTNIPG